MPVHLLRVGSQRGGRHPSSVHRTLCDEHPLSLHLLVCHKPEKLGDILIFEKYGLEILDWMS
jgi:hypothetical protein